MMIKNLRATIKFALFCFFCFTFFLCTGPVHLVGKLTGLDLRRIFTFFVHVHCKIASKFLAIMVQSDGRYDYSEGMLIVGNHLSYTDVIALNSLTSSCFITSVEMKNMTFLGQIAQMAGCVFVERRSKKGIHKEVEEIVSVLKKGHNVVLYAEATSTNGEEVLRFRRPMFQGAIDAEKDILPVTINYRRVNGRPVDRSNRDLVCWYGDMTFLDHFWAFLQLERIDVELTFAPVVKVTKEHDSAELATILHGVVSANYDPIK